MTLASSISLIFVFRNCCWGSVSGHWWILVENFVFSGILSQCTVVGTWVTSLTGSVKQLANSATSANTISSSFFVRSRPSVAASNTACTCSSLNASVWHVWIDGLALGSFIAVWVCDFVVGVLLLLVTLCASVVAMSMPLPGLSHLGSYCLTSI